MKNSAGRNNVRKTQPAVKVCERSFAMSRHHQRENPRCEAAARVMATEGGHLNQSTDRLDSRPHIKPVHMSIWFYMQCNLRAGCIKPERHHNSRGLGSSGCKMSWWVQRIILCILHEIGLAYAFWMAVVAPERALNLWSHVPQHVRYRTIGKLLVSDWYFRCWYVPELSSSPIWAALNRGQTVPGRPRGLREWRPLRPLRLQEKHLRLHPPTSSNEASQTCHSRRISEHTAWAGFFGSQLLAICLEIRLAEITCATVSDFSL